MLVRNKLIRTLKFLGKVIFGLLLAFLCLVLLIHIPAVQKKITREVVQLLTTKMEGRVDIRDIRFSILGDMTIDHIQVWDRDSNMIFSVNKIEVTSDLFDLLSGHYLFGDITIEGVRGHLTEHKDGLNIQYILDAFGKKDKQATSSNGITIHFKKVNLSNIQLDYDSEINGTSIALLLGSFVSSDASFSTNPNTLKADQILLERADVIITMADSLDTEAHPDSSSISNLFTPDFGLGIGLDINELQISDGAFAMHRGETRSTHEFDPDHIELVSIQFNGSSILMRRDSLAATVDTLSAELPGLSIKETRAVVEMNPHRLAMRGVYLSTGKSKIEADLTGWFEANPPATKQLNGDIDLKSSLDPGDLDYFLADSLMDYARHWNNPEFTLAGEFSKGKGEVIVLNLQTANSQLHVSGSIDELWDLDKLSWSDLKIESSIGEDFKKTLSSFTGDIKMPPGIAVNATTSGTLKAIFLDGYVHTTWGKVNAKGTARPLSDRINLDVHFAGEKIQPGQWADLSWLGPVDVSGDLKGIIGKGQDAAINGMISTIGLLDQTIHDIDFQSRVFHDSAMVNVSIADPRYRSQIRTEISFANPMLIRNVFQSDSFNLGKLLKMDSTLSIAGMLTSDITIDQSSIGGHIRGKGFHVEKNSVDYLLDTLDLSAFVSPSSSHVDYFADDGYANVKANFDLRDFPGVLKQLSGQLLHSPKKINEPGGKKELEFDFQLHDGSLFSLLGFDVDTFTSLQMTGSWNEETHALSLQGHSGSLGGYGVAMDTLKVDIKLKEEDITASIHGENMLYNSFQFGDLDFNLTSFGDEASSGLFLSRDSVTWLGLNARIDHSDSTYFVFPDTLQAFGEDYFFDSNNPVSIRGGKVSFREFRMTQQDMEIKLDGDLQSFTAGFTNLDLTRLNTFLFPDSVVINEGRLDGMITYIEDQELDLRANIDSLSLYRSAPISVSLTAQKTGDQIPFSFLLSNTTNNVDAHGSYNMDDETVDATITIDITNPELFSFLYADMIEHLTGSIKGEITVRGQLEKPEINGYMGFRDVGFTTVNPKFNFYVKDDKIRLDHSGLYLDEFTFYDNGNHPLIINGQMTTPDYKSYAYDLDIHTDYYTLLDSPGASVDQLKGLLVIASDITLKGDQKDTYVKAAITIKDTTNLTYVLANEDEGLLKTEGIVEFVDPDMISDSVQFEPTVTYYDSLVSSLPEFNLNSTITVEDKARLKVITNTQSGDFFEASGGARLELGYDRTGNVHLAGNYTIRQGDYLVSFYDLVRKKFRMVPGSAITWSGSPETGELDMKAVYTVTSNSIGLIGHEIGENEKSIYKRSLDYEVGISIKGTVEKPVVSFTLDLPAEERANYPVLANKLDRLRLPEFQTELNKQVFGLLVLGGFLPDASMTDVNSNQIATTALYNSVNSLLASQLNRFAGQHIKGVTIDVGIQSYADYSTPGGKTQTAMDFRVSKSILNDRLSFEVGGDFDINSDQSGANTGNNYRGDVAIIYDLTGNGDKQLKLFNNETYDIIYQEIRNTGVSLVFIREFDKGDQKKKKNK